MSKSYRQVNYTLRPAKAVERSMMCEAFQELSVFDPISKYQYVGFGSIYFADFARFYQRLNFALMKSIERESDDRARLNFNCPYDCVDVIIGESNTELPKLEWDAHRTVAWLDYDDALDDSMLRDIGTFVNNALSGSMLLITVKVEPDKRTDEAEDLEEFRMAQFRRRIREESIPFDLSPKQLTGSILPTTVEKIIFCAIESALNLRNDRLDVASRMSMEHIVHLSYSDNARMLSLGWVLVSVDDREVLQRCEFARLSLKSADGARRIVVPMISIREALALNRCLPGKPPEDIDPIPVPDREIRLYSEIHRHYPFFVETRLI